MNIEEFVTSHGKRIAVETVYESKPRKPKRKRFKPDFVSFPNWWVDALDRKSVV